ncbi:MAG: S-methyl-5-thioribose-1-phosphate isomerase [Bacteroidota bacterium]
MNINQQSQRSIWYDPAQPGGVQVIDQRHLPHEWRIARLETVEEAARAIKEMWVRGAPLIGATAAFGMYLAVREMPEGAQPEVWLSQCAARLLDTRPTAVNLQWALDRQMAALQGRTEVAVLEDTALKLALEIADEDAEICRMIGVHGLPLIEKIAAEKPGQVVNILTHCNAGSLATVDWGTATSPIYQAHQAGIKVHVWVDETRPRNQGARLTAWELGQQGVPHTIIADNSGGHLMQHGQVDLCIVGTDRTTYTGDVANKIGTYLKALAAWDNGVPFYVALPSPTIDWSIRDGVKQIPIEVRGGEEVRFMRGWCDRTGQVEKVRIVPADSPAENHAFDVTPAKYVTALITERGVCPATEEGIASLFPEMKAAQVL